MTPNQIAAVEAALEKIRDDVPGQSPAFDEKHLKALEDALNGVPRPERLQLLYRHIKSMPEGDHG